MRSLRLDDVLDERLQRAAAARGESVSEFIRRAVDERAEATFAGSESDFDDVVGVVRSEGGQARRTGTAFTDLLAARSLPR